jgi:hypothetical protein
MIIISLVFSPQTPLTLNFDLLFTQLKTILKLHSTPAPHYPHWHLPSSSSRSDSTRCQTPSPSAPRARTWAHSAFPSCSLPRRFRRWFGRGPRDRPDCLQRKSRGAAAAEGWTCTGSGGLYGRETWKVATAYYEGPRVQLNSPWNLSGLDKGQRERYLHT